MNANKKCVARFCGKAISTEEFTVALRRYSRLSQLVKEDVTDIKRGVAISE